MFCASNPLAYVSFTPKSSFSAPRAPPYGTPAATPCIVGVSYPPGYTYTGVAGSPVRFVVIHCRDNVIPSVVSCATFSCIMYGFVLTSTPLTLARSCDNSAAFVYAEHPVPYGPWHGSGGNVAANFPVAFSVFINSWIVPHCVGVHDWARLQLKPSFAPVTAIVSVRGEPPIVNAAAVPLPVY